MPKDGVQIQLDQASKQNLDKQFQALGTTIAEAGPKAIFKALMKIKTTAQLYLVGRGHIVTSRLRNSIYVQMNNQKETSRNKKSYKDRTGKSYNAELKTVSLATDFEGAVGTNVEYAAGIEFGFRPHTITAKNGGFLSFLPQAKGEAWFTSRNKSSIRKYYNDKDGNFTLKRNRIFVKSVNHPGYAGDSYLYKAVKSFDISKTVGEEMRDEIKFGKYLKKGVVNRKIGAALTNSD